MKQFDKEHSLDKMFTPKNLKLTFAVDNKAWISLADAQAVVSNLDSNGSDAVNYTSLIDQIGHEDLSTFSQNEEISLAKIYYALYSGIDLQVKKVYHDCYSDLKKATKENPDQILAYSNFSQHMKRWEYKEQ